MRRGMRTIEYDTQGSGMLLDVDRLDTGEILMPLKYLHPRD